VGVEFGGELRREVAGASGGRRSIGGNQEVMPALLA
jgi:hypothetical protein